MHTVQARAVGIAVDAVLALFGWSVVKLVGRCWNHLDLTKHLHALLREGWGEVRWLKVGATLKAPSRNSCQGVVTPCNLKHVLPSFWGCPSPTWWWYRLPMAHMAAHSMMAAGGGSQKQTQPPVA